MEHELLAESKKESVAPRPALELRARSQACNGGMCMRLISTGRRRYSCLDDLPASAMGFPACDYSLHSFCLIQAFTVAPIFLLSTKLALEGVVTV